MSERKGTQRGVDFCKFMADHPLGQEKSEIESNDSIIKAIKSKKLYQSFKRGNNDVIMKPDPTATCEIDDFVDSDHTAIRAICYSCLRRVIAERVIPPTEK